MKDERLDPQRTGFTLIELLVVVAIIAVLVAILLPAMSQVRTKAITLECQSSLRQLGIGINLYADEHDEWLPPAMNWYSDPAHDIQGYWDLTWYAEVAKILAGTEDREEAKRYRTDMKDLFWCRGVRYNHSIGYTYSWAIHNTSQVSPSGWGLRGRRGHGNNPDDMRVILHCGNDPFTYTACPYNSWIADWMIYVSQFHDNGSNFLCVSTNVKWVRDRGNKYLYYDGAAGNTDIGWW